LLGSSYQGWLLIVLAEGYDRDDLPLKVFIFLLQTIQPKVNEDEVNKTFGHNTQSIKAPGLLPFSWRWVKTQAEERVEGKIIFIRSFNIFFIKKVI